jgi:hypothetical protein
MSRRSSAESRGLAVDHRGRRRRRSHWRSIDSVLGLVGSPRRTCRRSRRRRGSGGHLVDTDQAVIWAGAPPWVGFSYYFRAGPPSDEPPEAGFDWSAWAYKRAGVDVAITMLQVTIQAKLKATVVLDAPIVRVVDRKPVKGGIVATYGAVGPTYIRGISTSIWTCSTHLSSVT